MNDIINSLVFAVEQLGFTYDGHCYNIMDIDDEEILVGYEFYCQDSKYGDVVIRFDYFDNNDETFDTYITIGDRIDWWVGAYDIVEEEFLEGISMPQLI